MQISEIQEKLPSFIGKKTELKNLHLTLKFIGEISSEELEKVKLKLGEINFGKFEAEINELGIFDNIKSNKYDQNIVIWLGVTNCDSIQREVDNSLEGLFQKENRFMGHLTIARAKNISNKKKFLDDLKKIQVSKMFFTVDNFYLMESKMKKEGPEYKEIEKYNLN